MLFPCLSLLGRNALEKKWLVTRKLVRSLLRRKAIFLIIGILFSLAMPETAAATTQAEDRPLSLSRRDYTLTSPGTSSGAPRSSSGSRAASAPFDGQLGGYHHAALAAAASMSHHRESSAFVPVVPSRNVHPMLYPGEIHPLLIREKQVFKNFKQQFLYNLIWFGFSGFHYKFRRNPS